VDGGDWVGGMLVCLRLRAWGVSGLSLSRGARVEPGVWDGIVGWVVGFWASI